MSGPSIRIQSLVEAQEAPTVVVDREYRIVAANATYCTSYGVQPTEIVGRRCHEVSHHSPVPCHLNGEHCPHHEVFSTMKPFDVLHTHYDQYDHPDHVRIKAYPLQDASGAAYLMETIHRLAPSAEITCEEMQPGAPSLSMARQDFPVPLAPFGHGAYSACGFAFGRPRSPCGPANTAGPQWLYASRSSATADYAPSLRSPWRAAMVGKAPAFLACVENLTVAARSDAPVLLYGETGVGKELAARFVHERSARASQPFVELNCAAIPEALTESELFGHERGAFTGCVGRKLGLFEVAHGGTLFLDEIGELPLATQAKLLRVLDTGEFRRVGGQELIRTDAHVIAATNQNLLAMVAEGRFREDLYFRIAGIKVSIPPLRERRADIPALAEALVKRLCKRSLQPCRLTKDAIERLVRYDYPGNIRELRNILQKAVALGVDGVISAKHIHLGDHHNGHDTITFRGFLPARAGNNGRGHATASSLVETPKLREIEARYLEELLKRHGGRRRAVADAMGVSERTVYRRIKQLGLVSA